MTISATTKLDATFPGVSADAVEALGLLRITTVSELAHSPVFAGAARLVSAANNTITSDTPISATSFSTLVKKTEAGDKLLREVPALPINVLQGIPDSSAKDIAAKLNTPNVRDISLYSPYHAAKGILNILNPLASTDGDSGRPADLLPKSGEYALDTVEYSTLLLGKITSKPGLTLADVNSESFSPMIADTMTNMNTGFKSIAYGALLTFTQSWFAKGITLGELLHSVTLAPGESTRIAVIDWSRQTKGARAEDVNETSALDNNATHKREINEVTNAVAREAQSGFSRSTNNSSFQQASSSSAFNFWLASGSSSSSRGSSQSQSEGSSSSTGTRDIAANMLQNALDATQQVAHEARDRRASVIQEVSQSEQENISSRVITNYNHMHALSVQYYEVVQVYRVEMALKSVDKVIFIPVLPPDLTDLAVLRRFRDTIYHAALTPDVRNTVNLTYSMEVSLNEPKCEVANWDTMVGALAWVWALTSTNLTIRRETMKALAARLPGIRADLNSDNPVDPDAIYTLLTKRLWSQDQLDSLSRIMDEPVSRHLSTSLFLSPDTRVVGASVQVTRVTNSNPRGEPEISMAVPGEAIILTGPRTTPFEPVLLSRVQGIIAEGYRDDILRLSLTLRCDYRGTPFDIQLPTFHLERGARQFINIKPPEIPASVKDHLKQNHEHYAQAILRSLDTSQITSLLSGYGMKVGQGTVPLADLVDPAPVGYVGNYLAFKTKAVPDDEAWSKELKDSGFVVGSTKTSQVPLSSGGVFAEAVLGRSNCAEKLDITRFWNWQDSPPPFAPGDIKIQAGSRGQDVDLKPGQFSTPIISLTQPSTLPNPTGTSGILSALQNGSMFRDMSGLESTIALSQAGIQATQAGASEAAKQATQSMQHLLQANTERFKATTEMVTSLAKAAASVYTGGLSSALSSSDFGAKLNQANKVAGSDAASGTSGGTTGAGSAVEAGGAAGAGSKEEDKKEDKNEKGKDKK